MREIFLVIVVALAESEFILTLLCEIHYINLHPLSHVEKNHGIPVRVGIFCFLTQIHCL